MFLEQVPIADALANAGLIRNGAPSTLRRAKPNDFETIMELTHEMVEESMYPFAVPSRMKVMELFHYPKSFWLIAENALRPVGFAGFIIAPFFWSDVERATDLALFIQKPYRGRTLARQMLQQAEEWAREKGEKQLFVGQSVGHKVEATKNFYVRNGYEIGGFNTMKVL